METTPATVSKSAVFPVKKRRKRKIQVSKGKN